MKKLNLIFPVLFFAIVSCGGNDDKNEKIKGEEKTETVNENILNPLKADFSKPIDPQVLNESMKVYFGKEIQLIVYPITYFEKEKFSDNQACASSSNSENKDIYIKWKTIPNGEFKAKTAYLVKGKIDRYGYFNSLEMSDVELIGEAKDNKTETFDPQNFDSISIYKADEITKYVLAWKDKKITVIGDYLSTTVSKSVDGKTIYETRVDLGLNGSYDYVVGCAFKENPESQLKPGMKNVKIEGKLDIEMHYDRPYLTECVVK